MRKLIAGAGLGAALTYLFDSESGARRRAEARDRLLAFLRRRKRDFGTLQADAHALVKKATHLREKPKPDLDDATLAQKVQSQVFRHPDVPKGQINVNAEEGIVILRGQVDRPELIRDLEKRTRKVHGVKGVENLLHLPGAETPMHSAH